MRNHVSKYKIKIKVILIFILCSFTTSYSGSDFLGSRNIWQFFNCKIRNILIRMFELKVAKFQLKLMSNMRTFQKEINCYNWEVQVYYGFHSWEGHKIQVQISCLSSLSLSLFVIFSCSVFSIIFPSHSIYK